MSTRISKDSVFHPKSGTTDDPKTVARVREQVQAAFAKAKGVDRSLFQEDGVDKVQVTFKLSEKEFRQFAAQLGEKPSPFQLERAAHLISRSGFLVEFNDKNMKFEITGERLATRAERTTQFKRVDGAGLPAKFSTRNEKISPFFKVWTDYLGKKAETKAEPAPEAKAEKKAEKK